MPELIDAGALPKSTSGRRKKELDAGFAKALVAAFKKSPMIEDRPRVLQSSEMFSTKGRAAADGRRYANHVQTELDLERVSVTTLEVATGVWNWQLYIPLSAQNGEAAS